ncbi:O-antigen ligase family protein [Candidatus Curtissbacteria bacterium]|nr:O-antigen ligase family protein [Candidatus Curtissbacteria bacterium]
MGHKIIPVLDKLIWFTLLTSVVLTPLLFSTAGTELFEIPKMFIVYLSAVLLLVLTSLKFIAQGKIQIPENVVFFSLLAFVAIQIVSTLTSIDKFTSVFGYPTRLNGGLLSQFAYLIIFTAALVNLNFQKAQKLLLTMIAAAFAVALWGIPGHFGYDPNCLVLTGKLNAACWQKEFDPTARIFSTLGQPNWLASFMVMIIPLALSLLLISKKGSRLLPFAIIAALILALLFTSSISGLLGLAVAVLIFSATIGTKLIRKNFKIFLAAAILTALVLVGSGATLRSRIAEALAKPQSVKANAGTPSGQIRLIVWQGAGAAFKTRPLLGFGPETFIYSYYRFRPESHNATSEWNFYYNKAHNEFLNYAANTGILGLGAYLIFLGAAFFELFKISKAGGSRGGVPDLPAGRQGSAQSIKQNQSFGSSITSTSTGGPPKASLASSGEETLDRTRTPNHRAIFAKAAIAGVAGYLVTVFFGFSIVATQLFMFLQIAIILAMAGPPLKTINLRMGNLAQKAAAAVVLAAGVWLTVFVLRLYTADVLAARARSLARLEPFASAISFFPGQNPFYLSEYSYVLAVYASESKDPNVAKILEDQAAAESQKALSLSPNNILVLRKVSQTYEELSQNNPAYKIKLLELNKRETELAPTDPSGFLNLAKAQLGLGKNQAALKSLGKAVDLKPDYQEARGLLDQTQGKKLQ